MEKQYKRLNIVMAAVLVVSLIFLIAILVAISNTEENQAESIAITSGAQLELSINEQFLMMDAMEAFTFLHRQDETFGQKFDAFVVPLFQRNQSVKNVSVAPGGVQGYVYPLEGNEGVLGHNLLTDDRPNVRRDVNATIETGNAVVSGPYELRQGGQGIIIRKALYEDDNFWGLIAMVVDFPQVVAKAGLNTSADRFAVEIAEENGTIVWGQINPRHDVLASYTILLPSKSLLLNIRATDASALGKRLLQTLVIGVFIMLNLLTGIILLQDQRYQRKLEVQVKERTDELQLQMDENESRKMVAIGSLVKGICHEVNTPLGSSLTLSTFVSQEVRDMEHVDKEEQENILDSMDKVVTGLQKSIRIIDNLKMISEGQGSHEKRYIRLYDYLHTIMTHQPDSALYLAIKVQCDPMLEIYSYPGTIYQVMRILVDNSMNHGFEGKKSGTIEVKVFEKEDDIIIRYEDDGIGIPEEIIDKVFDPFLTTKMGQYRGLGLYNVFTMVTQQLHGTIQCEYTKEVGALFIIRIPKVL